MINVYKVVDCSKNNEGVMETVYGFFKFLSEKEGYSPNRQECKYHAQVVSPTGKSTVANILTGNLYIEGSEEEVDALVKEFNNKLSEKSGIKDDVLKKVNFLS